MTRNDFIEQVRKLRSGYEKSKTMYPNGLLMKDPDTGLDIDVFDENTEELIKKLEALIEMVN